MEAEDLKMEERKKKQRQNFLPSLRNYFENERKKPQN